MDKSTVRLLAAAVLLAAALLVRVDHLDWGLPTVEEEALPTKVALQMWGFEDGTPDFDPGTAGWPAMSFYVQRAAQQLHYVVGRMTGSFPGGPMDYYVAWLMDPTTVILIGRVTSVLCSLIVCLVALLVGFRFDGVRGGIVAGALCAFSPLLVRHAQYVEPDALVSGFAALALLWCLRILDRGRVRDYALAGLWIGLGTASKYTPVLMAATVLAVHLERRRAEGLSNRWLGLDDRRIGWAALVAVLAFCLTSPYTLADLQVLRRDFAYQALHMRSGHFGHEQQGLGYWHYLTVVLPEALGWPGLVAAIGGLALAARAGAGPRVVLWTFVPYFLVLGSLSTHFDRYMLPLVLPLSLAAALLVRATARRRAGHGIAAAGLTVLLLAMPVVGTYRHHRVQSAGSTQEKAGAWILEHMDVDREVLATEQYGPSVPLDQRDEIRRDPAFARMTEDQRERLLERPFVRTLVIPMYSVRTDLAGYYYDLRHYLTYDWLALSRSVRNRYEAAPERFPRQVEFYRLVDALLDPEVVFTPEGKLRGPGIAIYRLDDGVRAQIRERLGPLEIDDFVPFATRLHAPHFLAFAEGIAAHAEFRERWEEAALWWQILGRAAPDPELRARSLERAGLALMRLHDHAEARPLFEQLQGFAGREVVAWANLGLIAESGGDVAAARAYYERILANQPDARAEEWARRRLAGLDAGN